MPMLSVKYSPATGASRGIGTAIPKRLAAAAIVVEDIEPRGGKAIITQAEAQAASAHSRARPGVRFDDTNQI